MQFVGAAQTLLEQFSDLQSRFVLHPTPTAHCMHEESSLRVQLCAQLPPQSTPVSVPFLNVSPQAGVAHLPLGLHQPLVQSESAVHVFVSAHLAGQVPPQSTSDSVPFFTLSEQVGCVQTPVAPLLMTHQDSRQSVFTLQPLPLPQAVVLVLQFGPPQSKSVSC